MNRLLLCKIGDEDLRRGAELIGDDVEVAVVIDVEGDGGARPHVAEDRDRAGFAAADRTARAFRGAAVDVEPGDRGLSPAPRLDPKEKFRVEELLAAVVQQERVDSVSK